MWNEGRAHDLGVFAVEIVEELWPGFIENTSGNWLDLHGLDGWLDRVPVQIKADTACARTGNFYHEHYKKTYEGRNDPLSDPWRISPCWAVNLIFVTSFKAYVVSVDAFARAAFGKPLTKILDTSAGFLVPMSEVTIKEEREHRYPLLEEVVDDGNPEH
jgi:hypothetical protein